ncbi:WD repeat-containing protein 73 [Rhinatrema bivittatum]|uniref:WD repeat-containing protein 73 n=1 Tax=Rhinatrema bivittatum TaxID=194408 RepID=UPI00112EE0E9|nr:WD repeat-containing protein 73 [Rhinatrema bivittatum]
MADGEWEDEWLIESIRLYKDLHVFELQDPTRVIEWTGEKSICVAGYEKLKRNEILQLLLPQKLYAKENQGLCAERDFKVEHGGFSDWPVYNLKHVPNTSLLLTTGPEENSIQIWQIAAEDSDVIKPVSNICTEGKRENLWTRIATTSSESSRVLHGSVINNIHITEIESQKSVYTLGENSSDAVSSLDFLDSRTVLVCSVKGQLYLADTREAQSVMKNSAAPPALSGERWCMGVRSELQAKAGPSVARLSSEGQMVLSDVRNFSIPMKKATCNIQKPSSSWDFLSVTWAPVLDDCLAISGFNGTVHIYDTKAWDMSAAAAAEPLFIHKGHAVNCQGAAGDTPSVTAHVWHPWKPRTLLSSASDGSLHVWDWTEIQSAG